MSFENTRGKEEIAHNKQFLFFSVFFTRWENFLPFSSYLKLLSATSLSLEESKISRLGEVNILANPVISKIHVYGRTRCVCEILMAPQQPFSFFLNVTLIFDLDR